MVDGSDSNAAAVVENIAELQVGPDFDDIHSKSSSIVNVVVAAFTRTEVNVPVDNARYEVISCIKTVSQLEMIRAAARLLLLRLRAFIASHTVFLFPMQTDNTFAWQNSFCNNNKNNNSPFECPSCRHIASFRGRRRQSRRRAERGVSQDAKIRQSLQYHGQCGKAAPRGRG